MMAGGLIAAALLIFWICSTKETRAEGDRRARPWGHLAAAATLIIWAAVILLPRG